MIFVVEENQLENKFLSQTKNITELMNSTFKKQLSRLTESLLKLRHAQNALKQQKKHNKSRFYSFGLALCQVFLCMAKSKARRPYFSSFF